MSPPSAAMGTAPAGSERRARRGPKPGFTREQIAQVALTIAREHGIGSLSLRLVAESLGIHQTSLYTYVDSKDALIRAMLDEVFNQRLPLPAADDPRPAKEQLREVLHRLWQIGVDHPELLALTGRRDSVAPGALATSECVLGLLARLGLQPAEQVRVWRLLYHVTFHSAMYTGNRQRAIDEGESPAATVGGTIVDHRRQPNLRRTFDVNYPEQASLASYDECLDLILDVTLPALARRPSQLSPT